MASLLLVVVVLVVLLAAVLAAVAVLRGSRRRAGEAVSFTLGVVVVYAAALVVTSLTSRPRTLAYAQVKCFDDWCVTLQAVRPVPGHADQRQLTVVISSRAARVVQRPDHPAVYLVAGHTRRRVHLPGLDQRLIPGQAAAVHVTLAVPSSRLHPQLLITEGGFPSRAVIGDENSPWHARSTWSLSPVDP